MKSEKGGYMMGNSMMFPLRMTEAKEHEEAFCNKYLYPCEIKRIVDEIEEYSDNLEYDGSIMFDEYPDKVIIENIVKKICMKLENEMHIQECEKKWLRYLVQVMMCSEIRDRKNRRKYHKKRIGA